MGERRLARSSAQDFAVAGDGLYLVATDAVHGFELWRLERQALDCGIFCDGFEHGSAARWTPTSP